MEFCKIYNEEGNLCIYIMKMYEDESGIAEFLRELAGEHRGENDVRADAEVPQAHHADEVEAAAADRVDDGSLEIGGQHARGAEVRGREDLEDCPNADREKDEHDQALVSLEKAPIRSGFQSFVIFIHEKESPHLKRAGGANICAAGLLPRLSVRCTERAACSVTLLD